ncbi:MAG TPA: sigma-70 family RNA polymerase sigma factor [Opitutaceae bacterium]
MDEPAPDYEGWIASVREGDQGAARRLVDALFPLVLKIVRAHLPRRTAEEDLAQEVFLKMFTRLDQYRGLMPFPHWVSRIAVTTCIDQLRHQRRRPELRWADLSETEAEVLDATMTDTDGARETDALAARELVGRLMEQLDPKDRLVLQMLDLEQKSVAEIAVATGFGHSAIKVRAFRARRKLRRLFEILEKEEQR